MNETPYLNSSFKILWWDTTIATKNPTDPPRSDKTHKAFSGIRHIFCSIFIHQHEDKDQNIDYEQPNDKNKFHAFQERFNSPTTWLFREREREGKILRLILKSIPLQKLILGILA
ncbi:hypothetical protein VN1070_04180 [Helicobacter pylori]